MSFCHFPSVQTQILIIPQKREINRKNHKKSRFTLAKNVAFQTHKSTMAARCLISSITMSSCTLFRYLKMFLYFSKIVFIPNNTLLILSIRQSAVARSSPLSGVTCASIASLSTRHWRRRRRPLKRSRRKRLIESLSLLNLKITQQTPPPASVCLLPYLSQSSLVQLYLLKLAVSNFLKL